MTNLKKNKLTYSQKMLLKTFFAPEKDDLLNSLGFHAYIDNNCNYEALEKSWNKIVEQNDALRIRIKKGIRKSQYIEPFEYKKLEIVKVDGKQGFDNLEKQERSVAVNLYGPLTRARLIDCGNGSGGLIVCMHNVCCDGYSMGLIFKQIENLYTAFQSNLDNQNENKSSYLDFIKEEDKYLKSSTYKKDCKWWGKKYKSIKNYHVPVGRPSNSETTGVIELEFNAKEYQLLESFCNCNTLNKNAVLMSIMAITTFNLSGDRCFSILNLSHGRRTNALKNTIGCITQVNPVFCNIDDDLSFETFAKAFYIDYMESLQHGRLPYTKHYLYGAKLGLQTKFNFSDWWLSFSPMEFGALSNNNILGLEVFDESELDTPLYCAVYDIPENNTLRLQLNYQSDKYNEKEIGIIKNEFKVAAEKCLKNPDAKISMLNKTSN